MIWAKPMKGTAKVRRRLPGIFLKRSFQTFKERVETQMIVDLLRLTTSRAVGTGQTIWCLSIVQPKAAQAISPHVIHVRKELGWLTPREPAPQADLCPGRSLL